MAALTLLLVLLIHLHIAFSLFPLAASRRNSTILPGSSLTAATPNNSYWLSPSGIYAFGFYPRGGGYSIGIFMVGIPQETLVWMARRDDPPVPGNSTLRFTAEGGLILQSTFDTPIAKPNDIAVSASMLDSGNFVLYNSQQNIAWQSFDSPTDTLLNGQYISAGMELRSAASDNDTSTGIFRIKMQDDGNLVMYPINTEDTAPYSYWSSSTNGQGDNVTLNLAGDGLLYLMNGTGTYLTNLTDRGLATPNIVYRARIDPDGIFRLYSYNMTERGNWSTVWSTTNNKCEPKGLCGFNAFCINVDQVARCQCLPGFDFVQSGNETSGCQRSFTAESCTATNAPASYNISVVSNTVWEDNSYSVVAVQTENECRMECLQDCNCEAAYYQVGLCNKQRLPLRYGRRDLGSSNKVFVKVGQMTPGNRTGSDPQRPEGRRKERIRMDILVVSLILIAVALAIIIACGILLYRNRVWLYKTIPTVGTGRMIEDVAPRSFTYDELVTVTRDFREVIGKGAFGIVYRGTMSNGKAVAVKRIERVSTDGEREFHTEMKIIGRTHHRNLVRLLGYSFDVSNRLLVYEYMSNGSLADLLFAPDKLLCWEEKMGIVRNIARGLLYLHEECETQIIHCDIKPENILIDEQRCAKISDFGLSKLLKPDQTNTYTRIRGTRGYVAPEWHKNLPVTTKADVYSFGIVLLEIIGSRRNMDQSVPEEEIILENWVYDCFEAGELHKLVDEEEGVDRRQLERMVKVAIWCTLEDPSLRPPMRKVLLMLEGTIDISSPPRPTSFISSI
ncbi:G-type lectin S-receptor-like serine/threonine-protein kinase LECRK3 [Punica granatum]|uniref:Receptor-like serine/threonine-protein kinase n=4 Tax=Punica granatum TaxID=22663 RepID=A0A6P8CLJ0_PUNGR|nr:G-type lectin S-receptor-like serine/threonine-protein kinase LECRK3 [Punica granatum]